MVAGATLQQPSMCSARGSIPIDFILFRRQAPVSLQHACASPPTHRRGRKHNADPLPTYTLTQFHTHTHTATQTPPLSHRVTPAHALTHPITLPTPPSPLLPQHTHTEIMWRGSEGERGTMGGVVAQPDARPDARPGVSGAIPKAPESRQNRSVCSFGYFEPCEERERRHVGEEGRR